MTDKELHRLSKLMSQRGLCSRREADRFIEQGLVRVNSEIINTLGIKFPDDVEIELTSLAQQEQNSRLTIMLNKPVGYVSGQAEDDYIPAVRLVRIENRSEIDQSKVNVNDYTLARAHDLAPAGRLDIDSQGVLILTQDGRIAKLLVGENSPIEKEYLVRVEGEMTKEKIQKLQFGLELDGKPLKRAKVSQINPEQLKIILTEGKKRQIRRMCEAVGLEVTGLKRVRIGELRLGKLAEGEWRIVTMDEFKHAKPNNNTNKNTNKNSHKNHKNKSPNKLAKNQRSSKPSRHNSNKSSPYQSSAGKKNHTK